METPKQSTVGSLWGLPIVEVEPEEVKHTGEFFVEYKINVEFCNEPMARAYSDDKAMLDLGRRIAKAISDGRTYEVVMERRERAELHPITHEPGMVHITHVALIVLTNYEQAQIGELAISSSGRKDGHVRYMLDSGEAFFSISGRYMERVK